MPKQKILAQAGFFLRATAGSALAMTAVNPRRRSLPAAIKMADFSCNSDNF
jgi:hypothetical protein